MEGAGHAPLHLHMGKLRHRREGGAGRAMLPQVSPGQSWWPNLSSPPSAGLFPSSPPAAALPLPAPALI